MEWKTIEFQILYAEPSRNGLYKSKEFHGTGIRIVNMKELFAFPLCDFTHNFAEMASLCFQ